jgi:hypothetical protein
VLSGLGVAPDAVLGAVEGDELDRRVGQEEVDRRPEEAVRARGVGDEPDSLPLDEVEMFLEENLDAGLDAATCGRTERPASPAAGGGADRDGQDQGRRSRRALPFRVEARSSDHGLVSFLPGLDRPLRITGGAAGSQPS